MKKLLPILIGLSLSGFSSLSQAENLMQVYQQARLSNPELRKSAADRDAAFEKINEARSPLLPQLGLGADYTYSNGYRDANGINSNATSASLQLTQSIFDMSKWRALTLQEKAAGIQDVTYQTDQQTLILNTATAYFNVERQCAAKSRYNLLQCADAHIVRLFIGGVSGLGDRQAFGHFTLRETYFRAKLRKDILTVHLVDFRVKTLALLGAELRLQFTEMMYHDCSSFSSFRYS